MLHTDTQYDTELYALRGSVTSMANAVERQFVRALDAVSTLDPRLVEQVASEELLVNQMHLQIDARCHQIIAKRQPIAVDLREIIAIMHMNADLERIGDEAKKIAFKVNILREQKVAHDVSGMQKMAAIVSEMLQSAAAAFIARDSSASKTLQMRDAEVDALRDKEIIVLIETMSRDQHQSSVSVALAQVFIVQSIERVGDHAKNIAEYVVTFVDGIDPRHARQRA